LKKQILAQILSAAKAEETLLARRRIGGYHALPNGESSYNLAHRNHIAS